MKKLLTATFFLCLFQIATAQEPETSRDANGSKTIKGFLTHEQLAGDTAFSWFVKNQTMFPPDETLIAALKSHKESINLLVFGGTWCDDTKMVLPQFYSVAAAAGFPDDRITLLGVDREKKTVHHLSEAFNVTLVPTFIVMKDGKEAGRVVEYGQTGYPLKELGEIISKL